jgi:hypothetical protein
MTTMIIIMRKRRRKIMMIISDYVVNKTIFSTDSSSECKMHP